MPNGTCGFTNGKARLMSGKMSVFLAFLLHSFKFVLVAGFPIGVIEGQNQQSDTEWNKGEMFVSEFSKKMFGIKSNKFADHPIRVGGDPDGDGEVVGKFRHILTRSPGDHNRNDQRWKDHGNT